MSPHTDAGALLKLADELSRYKVKDLDFVLATLLESAQEAVERYAASQGSAGGEAIPGSENMDARFAWLQSRAVDMGYMLVPEAETYTEICKNPKCPRGRMPVEVIRNPVDFYHALAECIASVPEEFQADLCRDFRINPKHVGPVKTGGEAETTVSENIGVTVGCICQNQHRRGHCTEPGCPFSIRPVDAGALHAAAQAPWKSISSAPKDGTSVLLAIKDADNEWCQVQGWYEAGLADRQWYDVYHGPIQPDYWKPLDAPPSPASSAPSAESCAFCGSTYAHCLTASSATYCRTSSVASAQSGGANGN